MLFHLLRCVNHSIVIIFGAILFIFVVQQQSKAAEPDVLPNTKQLMPSKIALDKRMVAGIDKFATRALKEARDARLKAWLHNFNTLEHGAFQKKMAEKRSRLKTIIGAVDHRVKTKRLEYRGLLGTIKNTKKVNGNQREEEIQIYASLVRWQVLDGVTAEGVLLSPGLTPSAQKPPRKGYVIVIPDAAWTPEQLIGCNRFRQTVKKNNTGNKPVRKAFVEKSKVEDIIIKSIGETNQLAAEIASQGCYVIIPLLINRESTYSGHPDISQTNIPHREWIYRMSFEMGRHIIGYELQKVLAAVDLFETGTISKVNLELKIERKTLPIGVIGIGEGGQIALLAGAIDTRIDSTMVCGYFDQREKVYQEPIYRNIWNQLTEFGDAELASMIAPRPLTVEACAAPEIQGPPIASKGIRSSAAPGVIKTPDVKSIQIEFQRAQNYFKKLGVEENISLAISKKGKGPAGSDAGLKHFLKGLKIDQKVTNQRNWEFLNLRTTLSGQLTFSDEGDVLDEEIVFPLAYLGFQRYKADLPEARQRRQFKELTVYTQKLLRTSAKKRNKFWKKANRKSLKKWEKSSQWYRNYIHEEVFGKLPEPTMPLNPKSRKVIDEKTYTGYEVTIDVYPDIFAGGILLLPKGMKKGEKRAVVVCQHGLEGTPMATITTDKKVRFYRSYKGYATQLVKEGFIVYSPQNPYRGKDRFRLLQRKSNPLKRSLYSYIIPQHQQTLKWLATLPHVDAKRIAFYGISYGGKTAVRVPPFLPPKKDQPGYCLSICSGDFNEWIKKCVSDEDKQSYLFHGEYEIWEWNMGHIANYAELTSLMTPRPFMVERGHRDGVAPDEWVAWEYAKVRKHYDQFGIGSKTEIEWFNGPHTINGKGTFQFLHKHLKQ